MTSIVFTTNPQNYVITSITQNAGLGSFWAPKTLPPLPVKPSVQLYQKPRGNDRQDIYRRVTDKIIADLEKGKLSWVKPWSVNPARCVSRLLRFDGTPYQGINTLMLWAAAADKGYANPTWLTYRKAQELGGQVRKGEKGTPVVYANRITKPEVESEGEEAVTTVSFLKGYTVFNVEQVSGLPPAFYAIPSPVQDKKTRIAAIEQFIAKTGAVIQHGGIRAFYNPSRDIIQMPEFQTFRDVAGYYATLAHELTHWTGHPLRLDRNFSQGRFKGAKYAAEELVAEIGAAFLCADLGITPEVREDHAAFIQGWLTLLKNNSRAVFTAASCAQRAVDFLKGLTSMES